jgi:hypothetical protein
MGADFKDFVSYMEGLAGSNTDIAHSAANKKFYRFELDEFLAGLLTKAKYPCMVLEAYDFNFQDAGSDNIRKSRSGAFMIIDRVADSGNFDKIHEVWDRCEKIGDQFLLKMRKDKQSRTVAAVRGFDIASCSGQPVMVSQTGQYGMRFTFTIVSGVNSDIDEEKWQ